MLSPSHASIARVLEQAAGSGVAPRAAAPLLLVGLCEALRVPARLVWAVRPVDMFRAGGKTHMSTEATDRGVYPIVGWVEMWCGAEDAWLSVCGFDGESDTLRLVVDEPLRQEKAVAGAQYIMAFGAGSGEVVDVTKRYYLHPNITVAARIDCPMIKGMWANVPTPLRPDGNVMANYGNERAILEWYCALRSSVFARHRH